MTKKVRSMHSFAIQRQPMAKPVATPRGVSHRDGPVAGLLRLSFRPRYVPVVMGLVRIYKAATVALALCVTALQPAQAAGNLTLPFAIPNPRITSWMDHHYPDRQSDGIMIRFDGATGYAYDGHRGTDYAVPSNTPVVAADDGTVIYSEWSDSGGWGVVIDHAYDRTAYFHNNQLFVYPGQHVSRGQLISLSGSTGNSTGPHVHFEVRDLLDPWHSVDPYGWTGQGPDPWRWDMGNLWLNGTPVPFLLPLPFPGGARWNYWYGNDGPPPPVTWHLRDGGRGLAGFAAQWDQDPGTAAARSQATSGAATIPGPGSHTLHLRVFDRAGTSADITYLYLYDVEPPTSALQVDPAQGSALNLHWSGNDRLSGVKDVAIDVTTGGPTFRPWFAQNADQPSVGRTMGAVRFFGDPGTAYQFRLTVRDAARNAAPAVVVNQSVAAGAGAPPTAADRAILGPLPAQPDGARPMARCCSAATPRCTASAATARPRPSHPRRWPPPSMSSPCRRVRFACWATAPPGTAEARRVRAFLWQRRFACWRPAMGRSWPSTPPAPLRVAVPASLLRCPWALASSTRPCSREPIPDWPWIAAVRCTRSAVRMQPSLPSRPPGRSRVNRPR